MEQVAAAAVTPVPTYRGLSLDLDLPEQHVVVVAMDATIIENDVATSLRFPLFRDWVTGQVDLVLYGSTSQTR